MVHSELVVQESRRMVLSKYEILKWGARSGEGGCCPNLGGFCPKMKR